MAVGQRPLVDISGLLVEDRVAAHSGPPEIGEQGYERGSRLGLRAGPPSLRGQ
jgi:hypothetical protein